jgi:transcriptional regulator with GAF, ATPase, and Fis domain/tetratricopeptide (TPR) repeat protein
VRGFVDLDERILARASGVAIARVQGMDDGIAIASHVARRAADVYDIVLVVSSTGTLWADVGARLGLGRLPCEPAECARRIAESLAARGGLVIAPLPAQGSWDFSVVSELVQLASAPPALFVTSGSAELACETYEIAPELGEQEKDRWFAALATHVSAQAPARDLSSLEAWWHAARSSRPHARKRTELRGTARELLAALSIVQRSIRADHVSLLSEHADLGALEQAGAIARDGEWIAVHPSWASEAAAAAAELPGLSRRIGNAVLELWPNDPWSCARGSELLLAAGDIDAADRAQARVCELADDASVRRELGARWMRAVDGLPAGPERARLQVSAAERSLEGGDAEAAFFWAKGAASSAPEDAEVTLLMGRAAVAFGDLVTAKVALERGMASCSPNLAAQYSVELAEVAYRTGEQDASKTHAERALTAKSKATCLAARNTLGKLLLAQSRWTDAERHFAEDAYAAAAAGERTAELRAHVNRGIAILSRGNADEARSIFESVLAEGERLQNLRACASALENLAVVAMVVHEYGRALTLSERTLKLRQKLGARLAMAGLLGNVAELRRKLGLFDHAQHAVTFGRRTVTPGMPTAYASYFSIVAARLALDRGNTSEAQREVGRAIQDGEALGFKEYLGLEYRLAARIALEDGDMDRAWQWIERAKPHNGTDEARADAAIISAKLLRAAGTPSNEAAEDALRLARIADDEELLREGHILLAELHLAQGNDSAAQNHLGHAARVRDQVALGLSGEVRDAFLARADVAQIDRLLAGVVVRPMRLEAPVLDTEEDPRTQRSARSLAPRRELIGDDPTIRGLHLAVRKVARTDSTILIRGESGTGKELVAEAVHRASDRVSGPFVAVNCAALVETLLLSELFGHEKGSFTGAVARRRGRFEMAEGGTLFLDEIGDISARTQVALLRILQDKMFERVGGTTPIRANVRVICATHRDLKAMVERGEFREDLYYRLRGITLEIPPLRSRMGDLPRIADHLLERIAHERVEDKKHLAPDAMELLERHRWPGNVRELENALRAASLFAEGDRISAADLGDNVEDLKGLSKRPTSAPPPAPTSSQDAVVEDEDVALGDLPASEAGPTAVAYACVRQGAVSLGELKRQIERDCIARALAETRGNITRAAALLGMKRPRLSQLVKQYGLAAVSSED